MPYAIIKIDDGSVVQRFGSLPKSFDVVLPGQIKSRRIVAPVAVGDEGLGYRFVEVTEVDFERPGVYFTQEPDVEILDGNMLTITRPWTAWTQPEIDAFESTRKDGISALFDEHDDPLRILALMLLDDRNRLAAAITGILTAADNAGSLGAFKTATALLTKPAQLTPAQLKAAFRAKIDNGA